MNENENQEADSKSEIDPDGTWGIDRLKRLAKAQASANMALMIVPPKVLLALINSMEWTEAELVRLDEQSLVYERKYYKLQEDLVEMERLRSELA